jgi:hypothetical protein
MRQLAALMIFISLVSCSLPTEQKSTLEQRQRESVVGRASTDIVSATQVHPPDVTVTTKGKDGSTTTVSVPAAVNESKTVKTQASETSDSEASGGWMSEVRIPFGLQLIMIGIGLVVITGGAWMAIQLAKKSKAVTAAWKTADDFASRGINRVKSMVSAETNPEKSNLLNSIVAALESERAELNKD